MTDLPHLCALPSALPLLQIRLLDLGLRARRDMPARLPHLKHVVLCRTGNMPLGHRAPAEVRDLGRVAPVHKHELGRAVLCVVRRLLGPNRIKIPDVDAAVGRGRGKVDRGVRGPGNLQDIVQVCFE